MGRGGQGGVELELDEVGWGGVGLGEVGLGSDGGVRRGEVRWCEVQWAKLGGGGGRAGLGGER